MKDSATILGLDLLTEGRGVSLLVHSQRIKSSKLKAVRKSKIVRKVMEALRRHEPTSHDQLHEPCMNLT